jgi:O-antigen/teichoic acid export membrane protein
LQSKLVKNLLSSGLQAIGSQILNVFFFFLISITLTKDEFGIIGWANAASIFIVIILGLGVEQVMVRRIAASRSSDWAVAGYISHTVLTSVITAIGLWLFVRLFKSDSAIFAYLPFFFAAQSIIFIASPLKQYLNARENFTPYGLITIAGNLVKIIMAFVYMKVGILSIQKILYILFITSFFELTALAIYISLNRNYHFRLKIKWTAYKMLLREASPQYISVIFDMALSRVDWILLGLLTTNAVTADYSFAYRASELAKLPILTVGPIILIKFSRLFANGHLDEIKQHQTRRVLSVELFSAVLIVLVLNTLWTPSIGLITHQKYGASNAAMFGLLSACLPFHFFINVMWTLCFAAKKYVQITKIAMVTAFVNLALNAILIPSFKGEGAGLAYLLSILFQSFLYHRVVNKSIMKFSLTPLFSLSFAGICSLIVAQFVGDSLVIKLATVLSVFVALALLTKQIKRSDVAVLKSYLRK